MRKTLDEAFTRFLQITRIAHDEHVRSLVGTDLAGRNIFPGFSVHDELALLVKAGLTPMEAIASATRNSAESLGKLADLGTVERGKIADLVLLEANPLDSIQNTKLIGGYRQWSPLREAGHRSAPGTDRYRRTESLSAMLEN